MLVGFYGPLVIDSRPRLLYRPQKAKRDKRSQGCGERAQITTKG
jgi:hypothetical protein